MLHIKYNILTSALERLLRISPVRFTASFFILIKAYYFLIFNKYYRSFKEFCWLVRVSSIFPFENIGKYYVQKHVERSISSGKNILIQSFRRDDSTIHFIKKYSISGVGEQDIFRDIIVLKSYKNNECGVILLKYALTFEAFLYFFDVEQLLDKYFFVLEPCWSGYYNANLLMWLFPRYKNKIIVQCYTHDDYLLINGLRPFFTPIRLGPADWVNTDQFVPVNNNKKCYDLVMVANWSLVKKHCELFKALKKIRARRIKVLLIGFAWGGRTIDDIIYEANKEKNDLITFKIIENLSHSEVVQYLNQCKVYVFLSEKEGDNKAIVEAMFTDLPAIVYRHTIGGASGRVNQSTGIFTEYHNLHNKIIYMLDNYNKYSPRKWALQNTGSYNSTKRLNKLIEKMSNINGYNFSNKIVEKINSPNLAYKYISDKKHFYNDYRIIKSSLFKHFS